MRGRTRPPTRSPTAKRAGEDAEAAIAADDAVSARAQADGGRARRGRGASRRARRHASQLPRSGGARRRGEEDAVVLREVGERPSSASSPATTSSSASSTAGSRSRRPRQASGSRFAYLLGDLVLVELALVRFAVETVAPRASSRSVPPVLVREGPLYGTGFFPGEREMIYEVERDELFLVGTSEVSLAALHADEILDADELPLRYAGISTCFRREAGAAGKDTRGIFRVHQFDKVEMFSFVRRPRSRAPSTSGCSRSRSGSSARSRSPTASSTSPSATSAPRPPASSTARPGSRARSATARSPRPRTRPTTRRAGSAPATGPSRRRRRRRCTRSNGTAVAVGRTLIALIENGQEADGGVAMPPALVDGRARRRSVGAERTSPLRVELQRAAVDAVAQAGRVRAVVEDVAEVGVAAAAVDLGALHEKAAVLLGLDRSPSIGS